MLHIYWCNVHVCLIALLPSNSLASLHLWCWMSLIMCCLILKVGELGRTAIIKKKNFQSASLFFTSNNFGRMKIRRSSYALFLFTSFFLDLQLAPMIMCVVPWFYRKLHSILGKIASGPWCTRQRTIRVKIVPIVANNERPL